MNIENNVKKHTNLLALHQNAQKANFRVTETWRGGQITCNGAQDSSWQRGRQAQAGQSLQKKAIAQS